MEQVARQKIIDLLERSIGLKTTAIGTSTLERAVQARMRATACQDIDSYLERLATSREMRQLVEEVVVPETWFFRDQQPFTFLADFVVNSSKDLTKEFFRILSIPCSSGEEPYSIVMTLMMAGISPASFFVDAVDVSGRVLERARQGLYRENSFRTKDLVFRDLYFRKTADGYKLQQNVHEKVRFLQGNIVQPEFISCLGKYDVVFCRNVLIYFGEETQRKVILSLHQLLLPCGILFTGYAEANLMYQSKMFSVAHAKAFAFHRESVPAEVTMPKNIAPDRRDTWFPPRPQEEAPFVRMRQTEGRPARSKVADKGQGSPEYKRVRQLADTGQLEEAARQSEAYLQRHGPSAEWYYLLGIIRDSLGQPAEALRLLRKAVYLDPKNEDCLIHLALLAEREGDIDGAANYKRRARKLREEGAL